MNLEGRCDGMSLENNVGNVDVVKKWQRRNMKNLEVGREGLLKVVKHKGKAWYEEGGCFL